MMLDHRRNLGCSEAWVLTEPENEAENVPNKSVASHFDPEPSTAVLHSFRLELHNIPGIPHRNARDIGVAIGFGVLPQAQGRDGLFCVAQQRKRTLNPVAICPQSGSAVQHHPRGNRRIADWLGLRHRSSSDRGGRDCS